jgi:hypothetical protein
MKPLTPQDQQPGETGSPIDAISKNLAGMVTEYVEGGLKLGTDWRNGLAEVIAKRLTRGQLFKTCLSIGRSLGKAAADYKTVNRESWAKIFQDEIDELLASNASCLSALIVLRDRCNLNPDALRIVKDEIEALENGTSGSHLINELRELRTKHSPSLQSSLATQPKARHSPAEGESSVPNIDTQRLDWLENGYSNQIESPWDFVDKRNGRITREMIDKAMAAKQDLDTKH